MTRRMTDAGSLPTVCRWEGMPVSEGNSARRVAELPQRTLHIQNMPLNRACRITEVRDIGQRFQPKEHNVLFLG